MTLATDIATVITSVTDTGAVVRDIANAQRSNISRTTGISIKSDIGWNIKTIRLLSQVAKPVRITACDYFGFYLQLDKVTSLGIGAATGGSGSQQQLVDFWY